jgi:PPOX class probable FMN-dependent enzyme
MSGDLNTAAALRDHYGEPTRRAASKTLDRLDKHCRAIIAKAPFLVLGTAGGDGSVDVSPKGDGPGFVRVIDDRTLAIPDRPGNNRVDGFLNLLENPQVGILFLVPGLGETLRVNGHAELSTDADLLEGMAVNGKPPRAALIVKVDEAFLHCAKAIIRSKLWDPETRIERKSLPSLGQMLADQIEGVDAKEADAAIAKVYETKLY